MLKHVPGFLVFRQIRGISLLLVLFVGFETAFAVMVSIERREIFRMSEEEGNSIFLVLINWVVHCKVSLYRFC